MTYGGEVVARNGTSWSRNQEQASSSFEGFETKVFDSAATRLKARQLGFCGGDYYDAVIVSDLFTFLSIPYCSTGALVVVW